MKRTSNPLADPVVYDWLPPLELWILECDAVPLNIVAEAWQDEHTLLLTSDTIAANPTRVTLEYNGPNDHLQTTWQKDWEPWGPILSKDLIAFTRPSFVDRGDPAAWDFQTANFTTNGNWYDLNLASIVPAEAKAVLLRVAICDNLVGVDFYLRKNGNANVYNLSQLITQVANTYINFNFIVALDSNKVIEYKAYNTTWTGIYIVVQGWFV